MPSRNTLLITSLLALALILQACSGAAKRGPSMATIAAEAWFGEDTLLPAGAVLEVSLSDVSRMDVAAILISEVSVKDPGIPPFSVKLQYDPDIIEERHHYSLRATIQLNEQLLFTSTEHVDPFGAGESGVVKIAMQAVPATTRKAAVGPFGPSWRLTELQGELIRPDADGESITLLLDPEKHRYSGFSGCNLYTGEYQLEGGAGLRFGDAATTRKACASGMELEDYYLAILPRVSRYQLSGSGLVLEDAGGIELARFTHPGEE